MSLLVAAVCVAFALSRNLGSGSETLSLILTVASIAFIILIAAVYFTHAQLEKARRGDDDAPFR